MLPLILFVALALVPILAIMFMKANAAVAFMALSVGSVLSAYVAGDMTDVVTSWQSGSAPLLVEQTVKLILLVTPLVLAILFSAGTIHGSKRAMHFIIAVTTGVLTALLVTPLLSADMQRQITALTVWHQFDSMQTLVIIVGASLSLLSLLGSRPHKEGKKHKH